MNMYFIQNATLIYLSSFSWWPIDLFTLHVFCFPFSDYVMVPQRTVLSSVVLCTWVHVNHHHHHHQVSSRQMAHKAMRARTYVCIIEEETNANSLENTRGLKLGKQNIQAKRSIGRLLLVFLKLVLNNMFYHRVKWLNKTTESFVWKFVCLFLMKFLLIFLQFTLFYYLLAQYLLFRSKLECFLFLSLRM